MTSLWPDGVKYDMVYLFVSDAVPYMVKCCTSLIVLYVKMTHVTCLTHGLHRIAESIRFAYPLVNNLISTVKKIFVKAPYRVQTLKEMCPNPSLPPEPILTRWGTWLLAAEYYADNLKTIQCVIEALDNSESSALATAKVLVKDKSLYAQLEELKIHYVFLVHSITQLEKQDINLDASIKIIKEASQKLRITPKKEVTEKLKFVLKNNTEFEVLKAISTLDTNMMKKFEQLKDMDPGDLAVFEFAPLVSCDVERSFSRYKNILTDNRRKFVFENPKIYVVVACLN